MNESINADFLIEKVVALLGYRRFEVIKVIGGFDFTEQEKFG